MKNSNGYYNGNVFAKFRTALDNAHADVISGIDTRVRISNSNSKMGAVASVSLLPFLTCPACCSDTCGAKCYAAKFANLRPSVLKSYAINTAILLDNPASYWAQVDAAVKGVRFFRFHVAGDILNTTYFANMIKVATNNPHAEILCFTKRFDVVNVWIDSHGELPHNLHILFSGWTNLITDNPHNLPETNVIPRGSEPADNWKICGGNCFNCACRGVGCWQAQKGDTIAFNMH